MKNLDRILNILFGLASLIGMIVTIIFTYHGLSIEKETGAESVLLILATNSVVLCVIFVFSTYNYINRVDKIKDTQRDKDKYEALYIENEIFAKHTAEYYFNLIEYTQKMNQTLIESLEKADNNSINPAIINSVFDDFHSYLQTFTSNLHSYFTLRTKDNCAITLKIINSNRKVKTLFRDPISYPKRRLSDFESGQKTVCDISSNTGFLLITNEDFTDSTYCCDDLYKDSSYRNSNSKWMNLYNATAIAPISNSLNESNKRIIGFVCVDNFNGSLKHRAIMDFLSGSAILIYPLLEKFDKLFTAATQNNIEHDRFKQYSNWGISGQN